MAKYGGTTIRTFIGSNLLLSVLGVQVAFVLAIVAGLPSLGSSSGQPPAAPGLLCAVAGGLVLIAGWAAARGILTHHRERHRSAAVSNLMQTLSDTSGDWLWAVDGNGNFTFSSRASTALLGYEPAELIGRPVTTVIDQAELAGARQAVTDVLGDDGLDWAGVPITFRHRTGAPVWMEVSGRIRPGRKGASPCSEGTSRPLPVQMMQPLLEARIRERIHSTVANGVLTAFQPIYELATGTVTGVEALTRFPSDDGRSPDHWFGEAASVGLGGHLEFAALEAALGRAAKLPEHLYVSVNISPDTCLNPMLPTLLKQSGLAAGRIVLELTESIPVDEYPPLLSALAPLRRSGLRIAVDDAGSGFSSMRHILRLRPDIIKLDRSLITGIDGNRAQCALGAAMVQFAREIGVQIVAEGIETQAELTAVSQLGMTSVQGYFLGRPSLHPADWEDWKETRGAKPATRRRTPPLSLPLSRDNKRRARADRMLAEACWKPASGLGETAEVLEPGGPPCVHKQHDMNEAAQAMSQAVALDEHHAGAVITDDLTLEFQPGDLQAASTGSLCRSGSGDERTCTAVDSWERGSQ